MKGLPGKIASCSFLLAAMLTTGCAHGGGYYRVHDPYYNDYHRWDNNEVVFYNQWAVETRHDPHRNFRRLNRDEQRQYWQWRHNRSNNHDRDHDRDHDHR